MLPTFHDALLTGLAVSERAATLTIRRVDGVIWRIELSGVRHLKAADFREGNIISEFEVISGIAPPRGLVETPILEPHPSAAEEYHAKYRAYLDALIEEITKGSLTLVSVTPSYGCELVIICETAIGAEVR